MRLNRWEEERGESLQLRDGRRVASLTLACRVCQNTFAPPRLWGRSTRGSVVFVGRTRCPYCQKSAFFMIRGGDPKDLQLRQMSALSYAAALLILPSAAHPAAEARESEEIVRRSVESLGRYRDEEIPAWIAMSGHLWGFSGIHATDHRPPALGEVVISPGLVYRRFDLVG